MNATEAREVLRTFGDRPSGGGVYFVLSGDDHVKIGRARDACRRLVGLQIGCPTPLWLVAVVPGGRAREKQLHERFAQGFREPSRSGRAPVMAYLSSEWEPEVPSPPGGAE